MLSILSSSASTAQTGPKPKSLSHMLSEIRFDGKEHWIDNQEILRHGGQCGKCTHFSYLKCNVGLHPDSCLSFYVFICDNIIRLLFGKRTIYHTEKNFFLEKIAIFSFISTFLSVKYSNIGQIDEQFILGIEGFKSTCGKFFYQYMVVDFGIDICFEIKQKYYRHSSHVFCYLSNSTFSSEIRRNEIFWPNFEKDNLKKLLLLRN